MPGHPIDMTQEEKARWFEEHGREWMKRSGGEPRSKFSGEFTNIMIANLIHSDDPPRPTPVHIECWESKGISGGYERKKNADRFIVGPRAPARAERKWVTSLPEHSTCWLCGEEI